LGLAEDVYVLRPPAPPPPPAPTLLAVVPPPPPPATFNTSTVFVPEDTVKVPLAVNVW
jgi:hypothetical protein